VGARPAALSGAFSAYDGDPNLIAYNPAGLAWVAESAASLTHNRYLGGINHEWLVYAQPYKKIGVSALGINFLTIGPIDSYDVNGNRLDSVSSSDLALNLAHAAHLVFDHSPLFDEIGAGLNLKYVRERLDDEAASAFAADFGFLVKPNIKGLNLGFAVQNLGSKMKFINTGYPLPRMSKAGFSLHRRLAGSRDFFFTLSGDAVFPRGRDPYFLAGYEQLIYDKAALRLGWENRRDIGSPFSFGLGLLLGSFTKADMDVDYAYASYGDLGNIHRFSLTIRFSENSTNSGGFGTFYIR